MRSLIILILSATASWCSYASANSPSEALGILSVDTMTQGALLWLKGRVGDASYTFTSDDNTTCRISVPIAVGSISESDLGVGETKGLTIIVVSQRLNDALIQGERINSADWHFSTLQENKNLDGLISHGISSTEGFVLNSRRRWISWLIGDTQSPTCH